MACVLGTVSCPRESCVLVLPAILIDCKGGPGEGAASSELKKHVHDEETMFELALSAMPEETLGTLRDFILTADQQTAPFTAVKAVCLDRLMDDRVHQIRQAITDEELAGRPPSVFLRRLQQLMPAEANQGS
ncbi:hypothetical protein TTRE_0000763801 [Trichuris trichiura]|uniref:DUF7041 domain-containing protein n=1 Tax=Trichuris trichiura TaxID=36087 RepID=A0A077ZG35_TRITR|nr:hypothetical protein TTRE_0000763801 [Trichuris trichiura]